jgi:hypothetical protein
VETNQVPQRIERGTGSSTMESTIPVINVPILVQAQRTPRRSLQKDMVKDWDFSSFIF